ncbi:hypothetical protein [Demequina lutea]|uniref:Fibronectin type-III domain-containing protein n=1 Tax=Demequina lutea TaxID=431489 RepID=A0A7Y9Z9D1_9MICO|nr:hypothetical protein [Demequina lutea]NYI41212.1 hypothetical protein [Demequina lutea]
MSAELAGLFRAAAHDEAVAAEREYPLGPDTVHRYAASASRRRVARGALIAAAVAVVIGAGALGFHHYWQGAPLAAAPTQSITSSASVEPSTTPSPTPTATPSPSPTASVSPTQAAPAPSETTPPAVSETTPPAAVPGQVTTVSAGPGGGSGETLLNWDGVAGATGYRVYRSSSAAGPFVASASVVVATGATAVEFGGGYEFIQIWRPTSDSYQYVEVVDNVHAYFRVAAFNAGGTGPRSVVVCGSPITASEGC